jgi:hypothetical protein
MSVDDKIAYAPTANWQQPPAEPTPPAPPKPARRRRPWLLGTIAGTVAVVAAAATGVVVLHGGVKLSTGAASRTAYTFHTYDNSSDPTFNQLLGVTKGGAIAGYFGSGASGHPNQGYQLLPGGQGDYVNENFPGAVQTQVTGLNDTGITVGFWSGQDNANMTNDNFGFYAVRGTRFHEVNFPTNNAASPPVNQLLGVNDHGVAVGFYVNAQGKNRGYEYSIRTHQFSRVLVPGAPHGQKGPSLTAAAINNHGDVAGFYTVAGGATDAFLKMAGGRFIKLAYPGASMTQAFGVNDSGEVVGAYTTGSGAKAKTHGFTWRSGHGFATVDDPHGVSATTINGVNDAGVLVGFYTDAKGNTDGMLAQPSR